MTRFFGDEDWAEVFATQVPRCSLGSPLARWGKDLAGGSTTETGFEPDEDGATSDLDGIMERGLMTDEPKKHPKPPPADALDMAELWLDPALSDGLVDVRFHEVPVGKPKDFFRVNPDPAYRRLTEIYVHKVEGQIDEQHFIIAGPMRGRIAEARLCTLVTAIYRDGSPRLWPLKLPKQGERNNGAWSSARKAARNAMDKWVKLNWNGRAYLTREALPGYAPDPDYTKLSLYDELVRLGFGEHGIIRDENHPIVRESFGAPPKKPDDDDDGLS
jgi:hypothetical protein